jgi:hypothetical protein
LPATRALTDYLVQADLLEPWPLRFNLGEGEMVDIDHLLVVAASRLEDPRIYGMINSFGVSAALFLSAHRLSLFKIGGLLTAAKSAVAARLRRQQPAHKQAS